MEQLEPRILIILNKYQINSCSQKSSDILISKPSLAKGKLLVITIKDDINMI